MTIVEVLLLLTEEFVIPMADSEEDISDTDHEQLPVPSPKRAKVIDGQQSSIKKFIGQLHTSLVSKRAGRKNLANYYR